MWNCKFGSIASIRKGQLYFEFSPEGVTWIKATLSMKIAAQINILRTYEVELADSLDVRSKKRLAWSINKMELSMAQISSLHSDKVAPIASSLRGLEGIASKVYFQAMVTLLPKVLTSESGSSGRQGILSMPCSTTAMPSSTTEWRMH